MDTTTWSVGRGSEYRFVIRESRNFTELSWGDQALFDNMCRCHSGSGKRRFGNHIFKGLGSGISPLRNLCPRQDTEILEIRNEIIDIGSRARWAQGTKFTTTPFLIATSYASHPLNYSGDKQSGLRL